MRRPSSWMKLRPSSFQGPSVSTATGTKKWVAVRAEYFWFLRVAAFLAAAPANALVVPMWDGATMSAQVASHARHFSHGRGIRLAPSGRKEVPGINPAGSLLAGIFFSGETCVDDVVDE